MAELDIRTTYSVMEIISKSISNHFDNVTLNIHASIFLLCIVNEFPELKENATD